jgi:hypothetical protein
VTGTRDHEDQETWYEIRLRGRLDQHWVDWLGGPQISHADDGLTLVRGPVADQAALHGLLHKLRDLGIPLISLTQIDPPDPSPLAHTTHTRSST